MGSTIRDGHLHFVIGKIEYDGDGVMRSWQSCTTNRALNAVCLPGPLTDRRSDHDDRSSPLLDPVIVGLRPYGLRPTPQ